MRSKRTIMALSLAGMAVSSVLSGCSAGRTDTGPELPAAAFVSSSEGPGEEYVIGPLDELTIFVWRNPELGAKVQVRPDGRITTPLITDMPAVGKTPAMLADDIKLQLSQYIENPIVSVIVNNFSGTYSQQIRIVGATEKPASLPYRANMTLLDAMIAVGGLSEYAAGNRARLVRYDKASGTQKEFKVRIGDLLKRGDSRANVRLAPGDVIIIPESMF
jgi:polysaccharide export outer membrane protein